MFTLLYVNIEKICLYSNFTHTLKELFEKADENL